MPRQFLTLDKAVEMFSQKTSCMKDICSNSVVTAGPIFFFFFFVPLDESGLGIGASPSSKISPLNCLGSSWIGSSACLRVVLGFRAREGLRNLRNGSFNCMT